MKIKEIDSQIKTPERLRIDALKTAKEKAGSNLEAERNRQQVAKAQKALTAARQIKPAPSTFL